MGSKLGQCPNRRCCSARRRLVVAQFAANPVKTEQFVESTLGINAVKTRSSSLNESFNLPSKATFFSSQCACPTVSAGNLPRAMFIVLPRSLSHAEQGDVLAAFFSPQQLGKRFLFPFFRVSDIRSYAAVMLRQTRNEADRAISAKLAIRLISSNEEIGWIVMGGNSLGGISRGFQGGLINWVFGTRADP